MLSTWMWINSSWRPCHVHVSRRNWADPRGSHVCGERERELISLSLPLSRARADGRKFLPSCRHASLFFANEVRPGRYSDAWREVRPRRGLRVRARQWGALRRRGWAPRPRRRGPLVPQPSYVVALLLLPCGSGLDFAHCRRVGRVG